MKKVLKLFAVSVIAALTAVSFAACTHGEIPDDPDDPIVPSGSEQYIFEAEYVDCSGIENAPGFSGGGSGTDIVAFDDGTAGASNGFYTTYLYGNGVTLEFVIQSDKAVSDATIVARLAAEGGHDFSISPSNYKVFVNDSEISYSPIQFKGVPPLGTCLPFKDYVLVRNVSLKEGENVIRLVTSNSQSLGGTTEATAPMVDCIKITTSAKPAWTSVTSNTDNF